MAAARRLSIAAENYVKAIYVVQQEAGGEQAPLGRLARHLALTPGTVTTMVQGLARAGLLAYTPRQGCRLTPAGEHLALQVLRRHRLVELFLVRVLGLDWATVHREAEQLEHAISATVLARLDAYLEHPQVDPHGDPIPTARGHVAAQARGRLANCTQRQRVRVVRVLDQGEAFLRFLEQRGLRPGSAWTVRRRDAAAETITLAQPGRRELTLGLAAAAKLEVEPL